MIHGTAVFSTADLGNYSGRLYGKYKDRYGEYDIECLEENQENGTTYCRIRGIGNEPDDYKDLKTSKLYDLRHSDKYLW